MFIIAVVTPGGGHMANIGKKMFIRLLAQYGVTPDDVVSVNRKTSDRQVWRVNDPAGGEVYALKFVKDHSIAQRLRLLMSTCIKREYRLSKFCPPSKAVQLSEQIVVLLCFFRGWKANNPASRPQV